MSLYLLVNYLIIIIFKIYFLGGSIFCLMYDFLFSYFYLILLILLLYTYVVFICVIIFFVVFYVSYSTYLLILYDRICISVVNKTMLMYFSPLASVY